MKNFFEHISLKYNKEATTTLKQYCRTISKLAKLKEKTHFLQTCRHLNITPTHLKNSIKHINDFFILKNTRAEAEKIQHNFLSKLLNVEIKESHTNIKLTKLEIKNAERVLRNTIDETEISRFIKEQWRRYEKIKQNTKVTHSSKLQKLKSEKFEKFKFQFNENWFINFTDTIFPKESKWLLSMGMKFALPVNKHNFSVVPLIADIEQWIQTIKDDTEKENTRAKIASRISSYKRNIINDEKEQFILGIYKDTKKIIDENKEKILITTSDKGNKTVVIYKETYKEKMNKLLEDKSTYKVTRTDPTTTLQKKNNNLVQELFKNKHITKFERIKLINNQAAAPELYGLPKIHKENIPLRPISSSMNVPCYGLAKHLGTILKNLISPIYNIKNSIELKAKINELTLEKDDILVSFDVVSLFTNIPTYLAIKNIMDKWETLKGQTEISKNTFLKLLQFCLNDNNYFTYAGKFYHQTYGMPMGNPLSPTIADIILDKLLDDVIDELNKKNIKIKFISKYVDDLFAIIRKNDEDEIMRTLNSYHNKIKFTLEIEKQKEIAYLDIKIMRKDNKLITNWYTKEIASGRMINYHSTQPLTMKINTATNFAKKVFNLSDDSFREENINKIKDILHLNNYPKPFILNLIKKVTTNTKVNQKEKTDNIFMSVPYIPKLTEKRYLDEIINDEKTTLAYKSNNTLHRMFSREKTKIDKLKTNNVVYQITCKGNEREECKQVYIGTTKRMLGVRVSEHEADIRKGKTTTALAQHVKEREHQMDFKSVRILDKERKTNKRYTIESLRIQERIELSMNTKEDKDNTKIQYSVALK